ncbi:unnamed protein product [Oppiella nova]|uniref:LIM zinc-binding domain-containing protein n=1 Tax=Oppiella nova TaxID=334625 RepID=A0A7R9QGV8_9ACAR|nr:unnamed protein product [Oppiella nova]CAG2164748.1 unnamed protein product [Oppiella nova]
MSDSVNSDSDSDSIKYEEECDNSSPNSSSQRIAADDIPGACITTHSVSSVIRPGCKMPRNDPLMFVKIHNNDLSKKAVEQIKLAEEVKITKEKIKEVEEEWHNNLMSWKSKRRQSKNSSEDESGTSLATNRKTKTFSEILSDKAKSGQRIGYNLHKYLDGDLENETDLRSNGDHNSSDDKNSDDSMSEDNDKHVNYNNNNNNNIINANNKFSYKNNHNREDSDDSSIVEITKNCPQNHNNSNNSFVEQHKDSSVNRTSDKKSINEINKYRDIDANKEQSQRSDRVRVEINDWKQQNSQQQKDNVLMYLLKQEQQHQSSHNQSQQFADEDVNQYNNSYDAEDDDEDDEELERIERLEQEKSFKAKLSAFENLAKTDEINHQNNVHNKNNTKSKSRDESKRETQALEELCNREPQLQTKDRPVVYGGQGGQGLQHENEEESEEVVNARIQQLHRERQRAQRPQPVVLNEEQFIANKSLAPNVIYQSPNYNQKPVQQSSQSAQQRQQYEQQQYYLMDESIGKQTASTIPMKSPQPVRPQPTQPSQPVLHKQPQLPYKQPIQATLPQEHLYVNQKQLFNNQISNHNHYEPIDTRQQRFGSSEREYYDSSQHMSQTTQQLSQMSTSDIGVQQQSPLNQTVSPEQTYPSPHNQYLYYPKPYASKQTSNGAVVQKPVMVSQQHKLPVNQKGGQPLALKPQLKQQQSGYNQNHWLLQEAELRRQLDSIPTQASTPSTVSATQRTTTSTPAHKSSSTPQKGMLSVSGKKKCSSCGDELGRGCAAMVVESLSLYYHINCFRCSVCNIQLGNGTVGTDVRVRNHKLHCQNCYSNDEAGLKFSRSSSTPQKGMLSVSGKKKCSSCGDELGRGCAAMVVESLSLYYHINCFRCSVCNIQLGNGTVGTDVRVRNHKLHCQNCYSNDEAGLKFSRV